MTELTSRTQFLSYASEAKNIIQPISIPDSGLDELAGEIRQTELVVPVVGGFSAGKSSLINSFLGQGIQGILPTAVTPETALPAELRYASEDYIESVSASGETARHAIADLPALKDNARNFQLLRIYLNSEPLKAIQPLVLVDMPGFDAPIEAHNRAILNYLTRGVYFVFLTSVEDGNITSSMKREIDSLQRIGKGFSFCISKTNLRPEGEVQAVREKVAEQLHDFFDYSDEITLLDQNGGENLKKILSAINPDALFKSLFHERLNDNHAALVQSIKTKVSALKGTQEESNNAVRELRESIDEIQSKKEAAIVDIENQYSKKNVKSIMDKMENDLIASRHRLVEMALQNPARLEREINDLVQDSLLANVQGSLSSISQDVIGNLSNSLQKSLGNNTLLNVDGNFIEKISSTTEKMLRSAHGGLANLAEHMSKNAQKEDTGNARALYRVIATTLSITTSVVAPIMEIALVFLPDIISFLTKGDRERKAREQAEQKIVTEIIPEIKRNIGKELPKIFNEQISTLISSISSQFEAQLAQKQAEIDQAIKERQQGAKEIGQQISALEEARSHLDDAAGLYLNAVA